MVCERREAGVVRGWAGRGVRGFVVGGVAGLGGGVWGGSVEEICKEILMYKEGD